MWMYRRRGTYYKIANDHSEQEEGYAWPTGDQHAVPHGFDPLPAKNAEDNHEEWKKSVKFHRGSSPSGKRTTCLV